MFDYFKDMFKYYFAYNTPKRETHPEYITHSVPTHSVPTHSVPTHSIPVNTEPKKEETQFKKNDGYKNINTNKILDVIFSPIDI
jgi:hypothetical protein